MGIARLSNSLFALPVCATLALFAAPLVAHAEGGTLKVVPQADLRSFDPHKTTATVTINYGLMVYDTLFGWDEHSLPQPQMVDSYEISPDRLTYSFTLRDGLYFADHEPVESNDVVASLNRAGEQDSLLKAMLTRTQGISATGPTSFQIKLTGPFPYVELALGSPRSVIMRSEDIEATGDKPEIRKAVALAIDQRDFMAATFGADGKWWRQCFSFFGCSSEGGVSMGGAAYTAPDIEAAKAMLKQGGYAGETMRMLSTQEIPLVGALSEVAADKLRLIGMNVEVLASDWGTLVERRHSKDEGAWHVYASAIPGV